jgi:hypothetical protein
MHAKRLHRTEHGFHYYNKSPTTLGRKSEPEKRRDQTQDEKSSSGKKKCNMQMATTKPKESEATA